MAVAELEGYNVEGNKNKKRKRNIKEKHIKSSWGRGIFFYYRFLVILLISELPINRTNKIETVFVP